MFFYASKIVWWFAEPLNLSIFLLLAGLAALVLRLRRIALAAMVPSAAILVLAGWTSLGAVLLQPLEDRFPRPEPPREKVAGIVVLGGGLEGGVNEARGGYELNASGDRFVEAAILARRFPDARVLVTGGSGSVLMTGEADADTAPRLLAALGVYGDRLILENRSRNTWENAVFSRELAKPRPGETWLLVTSAFHIPRAVGVFRAAGFPIVPWPADYKTAGTETFGLARDNVHDSLRMTSTAVREWLGLLAYRLTERTSALYPAP